MVQVIKYKPGIEDGVNETINTVAPYIENKRSHERQYIRRRLYCNN